MRTFSHIKVIGAGLIGTSLALGLKSAGYQLSIEDEDPRSEEIAQSLIGQMSDPDEPELIIIATPILTIPTLLKEFGSRYPKSTLMDIGGLKSEVIAEIEKFSEISSRFCATHPMAGREISGALAARGDLFEGRIWIFTPTIHSTPLAVGRALEVIEALGGKEVQLGASEHDYTIAGVSHLPQIVSSLLSASLLDMSDRDIGLAGQGLKDVSRLAASDPHLWSDLLHANRKAVGEFLAIFARNIDDLSISLQNDDLRKTHELLHLGRENHARIPGKHGGKKRDYWILPIVIEDKPGQLAKIFDACAVVGANVEDLSIEHTPGQESGLVTLALSKADSQKLFDQLTLDSRWKVHQPREAVG
jgi:prephenate dehydrogenase